jgi:hypothetical protein
VQGELLCRIKTDAKLWASQLRISGRAEVHILLAEVDTVRRDVAHLDGACLSMQKQIRGLLDSRRELVLQMHQMVPRSELDIVKAETVVLRGTVEGLRREIAIGQQERERVVSTMQVMFMLTQISFSIFTLMCSADIICACKN